VLRVLTVTLNPALDRMYEVEGFRGGRLNRPASQTISAGGKGINVSRAYRKLGGETTAMGIAGGNVGADIRGRLKSEGISEAFVEIAADSRTCIKITDPAGGEHTELNEDGPSVSRDEYDALRSRFRELVPQFDVVVLSGSIPPGLPGTVYAELVGIAQGDYDVPVMLDASGDALKEGIQARPEMVKPNVFEAKELGILTPSWQQSARLLREKYGVNLVIVTAGAEGAVVDNIDGVWVAVPPRVDVKSPVGSGDSLTAGFLMAWGLKQDPGVALRYGVAAGSANARGTRPGDIEVREVDDLAERVKLTKIG
jgi:tagatose 6-phosphate kinase